MRYVAAYLLAVLGGNKNPSNDDIIKILSSVGIEADIEMLTVVVKELSGKDIKELTAQGRVKLSSMSIGGSVARAAAAAAVGDKQPRLAEKKEEPKEIEDEPISDDDDMDMCNLFNM